MRNGTAARVRWPACGELIRLVLRVAREPDRVDLDAEGLKFQASDLLVDRRRHRMQARPQLGSALDELLDAQRRRAIAACRRRSST